MVSCTALATSVAWHRLADRPSWSAGLARTRGRQTDGDGQLQVNLMAAALFLFSESVLAAARNDFAARYRHQWHGSADGSIDAGHDGCLFELRGGGSCEWRRQLRC